MLRRIAPLLVVLLVTGYASAQAPAAPVPASPDEVPQAPSSPETPAAEPGTASSTERARSLFLEGMTAFEERRFHDAITAFRRASELVPSADLWFNIARSYEELGEHEAAIEYYRRYLRDRIDPPDRQRVLDHIVQLEEQAEAERLRARAAPTTGTLRIDVDVEGATVRVDGRTVGTSPIAVPLAYSAGEHQLDVQLEGYVPFRAIVRVDAGTMVVAAATMTRATGYRSVRGSRRFTWVMAGLGGASLIASAVLGGMAAGQNRDGDRADARTFARYSDYAAAGTAVFGLGTVILYFGEGRSIRTERVE